MTLVRKLALRGESLLNSSRFNKGTAFTLKERQSFGLRGRLPFQVDTLDQQCARAYDQFKSHESPIRQNAFLQSLKVQNWVLYYALLSKHLTEMIPIIYTPTEAQAISEYSHLFRRSEGLYLSYPLADTMEEDFLAQIKGKQVDLIVCSDGGAILGIGDQGVGGIGISTAKAVIYTLIGGVNPANTLPVTLDVGTENDDLLKDELYVGWPKRRVTGDDYDKFVDKFVQLVRKHLPNALLHFEDFGVNNALRLLQLYREKHPIFNDDAQGTGAVTLAALLAAIRVTKSKLSDQRIIIYGAGTAGLGIARQVRDAMVQIDGISSEDAAQNFWLSDKHGLLTDALQSKGLVRKDLDPFVRSAKDFQGAEGDISLLEVIKQVKPTTLIGCSTHSGAFTEEVVRAMKDTCERPIIFPLSNPSKLVEVDPKNANTWTDGMALMATGSPFPPVPSPKGKDYVIAECNNALIYPGLGLGAIISKARAVTDAMIIAGARRLAELSPAIQDPDAALLPDFEEAQAVNVEVAIAVAEAAISEGVARVEWGKGEARKRIDERRWEPLYEEYEYESDGGQ